MKLAAARFLAVLMFVLAILPVLAADAPARPSAARVSVELDDGCIIVGRLNSETLTFESQLLGKMQIPVERIATVQGKGGSQLILMRNGDTLQASLAEQELQIESIFGKLKIPRRQIIGLKCGLEEEKK